MMAIRQWFGFRGRIGRKTFWLGYFLPLTLAGIAMDILDLAMGYPVFLGVMSPVSMAVHGLALWPSSAGLIKRLHDRGRSGPWIAGCLLIGGAVIVLPAAQEAIHIRCGSGGGVLCEVTHSADPVGDILPLAFGLGILIELGLRRGTIGPNRYGPDPLGDAGR
jgi:uncharacterized membrane protein YhaH (DUF805 family)